MAEAVKCHVKEPGHPDQKPGERNHDGKRKWNNLHGNRGWHDRTGHGLHDNGRGSGVGAIKRNHGRRDNTRRRRRETAATQRYSLIESTARDYSEDVGYRLSSIDS